METSDRIFLYGITIFVIWIAVGMISDMFETHEDVDTRSIRGSNIKPEDERYNSCMAGYGNWYCEPEIGGSCWCEY